LSGRLSEFQLSLLTKTISGIHSTNSIDLSPSDYLMNIHCNLARGKILDGYPLTVLSMHQ
jgi:hypothetical protein